MPKQVLDTLWKCLSCEGMIFPLLFALQLQSSALAADLEQDPAPPIKKLLHAKEFVLIDAVKISMRVKASRDFMPVGVVTKSAQTIESNSTQSLMGIDLTIFTQRPSRMPASLTVNRIWVSQMDKRWSSSNLEQSSQDSATLSVSVKGGPTWPPGSFVDVVVQIVDARHVSYLLAKKHQLIDMTI